MFLTEEVSGLENKAQRKKYTLFDFALALVWLGIIILCALNMKNFTVEEILSFTPGNIFAACLIMAGLFALKSLSIFIYSGILFTVNGVLFSIPMALLMDCVGIAVMSTIPYFLGRHLGGRALSSIKEKYPSFREFDDFGHDNEFVFVAILRLIHFLPSDILSIYLGANEFRYGPYVLSSVLFVLPSAAMYSLTGTSVTEPGSPMFILSALGQAAVILFSFVALAWLKRKKDRAAADHSETQEKNI